MNISMSKLDWIISWGLWPCYFSIILLITAFIFKGTNSDKNQKIILSKENNRHRNHIENIDKLFVSISRFLYAISLIILSSPLMVIFNEKYLYYINNMIGKIEVWSNLSIGLTSFVITLSVFIVVFDKSYYLVFSIRDVLKKYKFYYILKVEILACILTCILTCSLLDGKIESVFDEVRFIALEYAFFISLVLSTYLLIVLINIVFSDTKKELKLLKHLYERLWVSKIDIDFQKETIKKWKQENTEINVNYLVDEYKKRFENIDINEIKQIEYVYVKKNYKEMYIKDARKRLVKIMIVLFIINIFIVAIVKLPIVIIIINFISTLGIVLLCKTPCKLLDSVIFLLYCGNHGYDVVKKDNTHRPLIVAVPLRILGKYDKYLNILNSLIAFFYIWIYDMKLQNNNKEELVNQFTNLIKYFRCSETKSIFWAFPVFAIGYLCFDNEIYIKELNEYYIELIHTQEDNYVFQKILYSQIHYIYSKCKYDKLELNKKIVKYFDWLQIKN